MAKYIKKNSLVDTLRSMERGATLFVGYREYAYDSLRTTARRLKKEGMMFIITRKGIPDGTKVIKLR